MSKQTIWTLSILCCAGFAMLGCQSDYQKMNKGMAEEYQNRYNMCKQSLITNDFEGYVGFGFDEEKGVCECRDSKCELGCNANGECIQCDRSECSDNGTLKECINGKFYEKKCALGCLSIEDAFICKECEDNYSVCIASNLRRVCKAGVLTTETCESSQCNIKSNTCESSCGFEGDELCENVEVSGEITGSIIKKCVDNFWDSGEVVSGKFCNATHTATDDNCFADGYRCEDGKKSSFYQDCMLISEEPCEYGCDSDNRCNKFECTPGEQLCDESSDKQSINVRTCKDDGKFKSNIVECTTGCNEAGNGCNGETIECPASMPEGKKNCTCDKSTGEWDCEDDVSGEMECPADMPEGKKNCTCDKTKGEWTDCQDEPGEMECIGDMPAGKKDCTCDTSTGEWINCEDDGPVDNECDEKDKPNDTCTCDTTKGDWDCEDVPVDNECDEKDKPNDTCTCDTTKGEWDCEDVPKYNQPCSKEQKAECEDENHIIYCGNSTVDGSWKWIFADCGEGKKCGKNEKNENDCIDNPCYAVSDNAFSCIETTGGGLSMCLGNKNVTAKSEFWGSEISCNDIIEAIKDMDTTTVTIDGKFEQGCYTSANDPTLQVVISSQDHGTSDSDKYSITYCAFGCNSEGKACAKCEPSSYTCDDNHVLKCKVNGTDVIVSNSNTDGDVLDYCFSTDGLFYCDVNAKNSTKLEDLCPYKDVKGFCLKGQAQFYSEKGSFEPIACALCQGSGTDWNDVNKEDCEEACNIDEYPKCNTESNHLGEQLICQDGMIKSEPCGDNGMCGKGESLGQCVPSIINHKCINGYLRCGTNKMNKPVVEQCVGGKWPEQSGLETSHQSFSVLMYKYVDGAIVFEFCSGEEFSCSGNNCHEEDLKQYELYIQNKTSFSIPWNTESVGLHKFIETDPCIDAIYNKSSESGSNSAFILEYNNNELKFKYCEKGCNNTHTDCNPESP